ncbi:MAG: hypothetical protein AB1405_15860 [Bdellovibrionota bacterium]
MALARKALVLLSGGLDSILATKILQEQGVDLEAFNVRTQFECCKLEASKMAHELGVPIVVADTGPDYLDLIREPKNGWGKGVNPCVDCRAYMFRLAAKYMEKAGASFLVTGEVLGQRPNSQMRHQLRKVEEEAGLPGLILRPLSAKLLDPTRPEQEGIVDRSKLFGVSGRSRQELMELAHRYGLKEIPQPSIGCRLTDPNFARRVKDAWSHEEADERWEYELLKIGRHLRSPGGTKIVLGRDEEENNELSYLQERLPGSVFFEPENFFGPAALALGGTGDVREFVGGAILRFTKKRPTGAPLIQFRSSEHKGNFSAATPLDDGAFTAAFIQ